MTYDGFWGITVTVPQDAVTCGICSDNNGNPDDDLYRGRYSYGPNTIESFAESWKLGTFFLWNLLKFTFYETPENINQR